MSGVRVTIDGRLLLAAAGKVLVLTPGTEAPPDPGGGTLSLALADFYGTAPYVLQRYQRSELGHLPVLFTFTGNAPLSVEARVVRAVGGAVVKNWTALTAMSINSDIGSGMLRDVPLGGYYLLQLRVASQPTTVSNGTKRWGVGVCGLSFGQSNNIGTFNAGSYTDLVPGLSQSEYNYSKSAAGFGSYFGTDGFVTADGSSGSGLRTIGGGSLAYLRITAAALKQKYGYDVPVALIPWAFNSQSLTSFLLPNGANTAIFKNTGSSAGGVGLLSPANVGTGDYEFAVMHQGEADRGDTREKRLSDLKAIVEQMLAQVAPYGRAAADFAFMPAVLGVYTGTGAVERLRGAIHDLEAYAREGNRWPGVRAGWDCIDLDTEDGGDGLHFDDVPGGKQYKKMSHRRMMQSIMHWLGCAPVSGMGPKLTGEYSRSGNVVTLTVAQNGGTALATAAGAPTGWLANTAADFSGADIQPNTVTVTSPTQIAVTLPNGTAYPVYLKHCGGRIGQRSSHHPDVSNLLYDNVAYPTGTTGTDVFVGRPLQPTPDALVIS